MTGSSVTRDWLERLYGRSPGYFTIVPFSKRTRKPLRVTWCGTGAKELDKAARAIERSADKADIYVSVGTWAEPAAKGRGSAKTVISVAGLWADLDIGTDGHKPAKLPNPSTVEEALSILDGHPAPSAVIHSGGGLQVWHLFDEPWQFGADGNAEAAQVVKAWQDDLVAAGASLGYHVDSVRDLARILRVPGTQNHKLELARPVVLITGDGPRHERADLVSEILATSPDIGRSSAGLASPDTIQLETTSDESDFPLSWDELLTPHGWTRTGGADKGGDPLWWRPGKGKGEGHSAVTHPNVMVNWSGSCGLPVDEGMNKLRVYAELNHKGDLMAAAKDLELPTAKRSRHIADSYLAASIADEVLAGCYVWCAGLGWLAWTGQRWAECSDAAVGEPVRQWAIDRFAEIAKTGDLSAIKTWSAVLSLGKQRAALVLARGIVERQANEFDADPDALNTPAGVVDLRTGAVRPHDPAEFHSKLTSGSYRPGHTHPDWQQALEALPEPERVWFQTRIGQAATGHRSPDGLLVILQGGGENGKSLLTTDGVVPALGDYATLASHKLIVNTNEHSEEQATLRGKRLLIAEEMTEGRALNVAGIKRITDVGRITARHVYAKNMTFTATHSLFATTNYIPVVNEVDHGTWRRLALLRFPFTFKKPHEVIERATDRRGDPRLKHRIEHNTSGQHDAIVTWVVEGAIRADKDGPDAFAVTEQITADTRAWRASADRILGYWGERLVADRHAKVASVDLLDDFNEWLEDNGHRHWSKELFGPRFGQHMETTKAGVELRRPRDTSGLSRPAGLGRPLPSRPEVWMGVRFRSEDEPYDITAEPTMSLIWDLSWENRVGGQSRQTPDQTFLYGLSRERLVEGLSGLTRRNLADRKAIHIGSISHPPRYPKCDTRFVTWADGSIEMWVDKRCDRCIEIAGGDAE